MDYDHHSGSGKQFYSGQPRQIRRMSRHFYSLTPSLRRFIPGRTQLIRIIKYGLIAIEEGMSDRLEEGNDKKYEEEKGQFNWTREEEVAYQAIKQAIVNNAMALPDPQGQYYLAVDASKKGIGSAFSN